MSREMELLKHAIATNSNYSNILQMEQQNAITQQQQEEGMLNMPQNTAMTFPSSSGSFHTQGMKFNLDISKFDNTGNLVRSYENTPPGIQSLSMGEGEGTVIETPSSYKKGGFNAQMSTEDSTEVNRLADAYNTYITKYSFMHKGYPLFETLDQIREAKKLLLAYNEKAPKSFQLYDAYFDEVDGEIIEKENRKGEMPRAPKFDMSKKPSKKKIQKFTPIESIQAQQLPVDNSISLAEAGIKIDKDKYEYSKYYKDGEYRVRVIDKSKKGKSDDIQIVDDLSLEAFNEMYKSKKGGFTKYQKTGFFDFLTNPIRKKLADNLYPVGYHADYDKQEDEYGPLKKVWEAIKGKEGKDWEQLAKQGDIKNVDVPGLYERTDLLQLLMGQPQKYNTIGISEYKPTNAKDKNVTYYTSKVTEDRLRRELKTYGYDNIQNAMLINQSHSLGTFKLDKGEDERGKYISYYDVWDLHPWQKDSNINKTLHNIADKAQDLLGVTPPEIYGRIYIDDNKSAEPQSKVTIGGIRVKEKKHGGFTKYQSKGFTIKREEQDQHIRDVDISGVDFNLLYNAIEQHEHRGVIDKEGYDSFIRTNVQDDKGSSAYGPIQLTHTKLLDLVTSGKRAYYDIENVDTTFHAALLQQADDMLTFGGSDMPEEGITKEGRDVSMYDYGQPGIMGNTTRDREKYRELGIQILEGSYREAKHKPKKDVNILHQMLKNYGTGTDYYAREVIKIYKDLIEKNKSEEKIKILQDLK